LLNDRSSHTVHRFVSCPLGTVSERPRLEVRLEDWFQYELERTLHHAVPDRGHSHIELHSSPASLWVPLKSRIHSIHYEANASSF
jgi:hypothetical protein